MTKAKAHTERKRLEDELATISRKRAEAGEAARAASARVVQLKQQRRGLLADAARDLPEAQAKLDANTLAAREAEAEAKDAGERNKAGQRVQEVTRRELRRHLAAHIDVFVAANGEATDRVMGLRERAIEAAREAERAEGPVLAEWRTLIDAVKSNPEPEDVPDANTGGTNRQYISRDLGQLPQSPIPDLAEALANAPRPEPANLRDVAKNRRLVRLLPAPLRRALGGSESKAEPSEPDSGGPFVEVTD